MIKLLALILFYSTAWAQRTYTFDTRIEYLVSAQTQDQNDSIFTLLTNSKDNAYYARMWDTRKKKSKLTFLDQNGTYAHKAIAYRDLDQVRQFDCGAVSRYENPYKYQMDNYAFSQIGDTLINGIAHKTVRLRCINKERSEKKQIGSYLYIVNPAIAHKPVLLLATAYEIEKTRGGMPAGLLVEQHHYDFHGQWISSIKLTGYRNIQQNLIIPQCNE